MEVHHSHSHGHNKKAKEYFLEFFMLFLAVSLGFLAENIREHFVEKERAHELLQSFMNDVRINDKLIDSLEEGNKNVILKNDSAILYVISNDKIEVDSFFNFIPYISYRYLYNNETYEQMKSSGSLRYIKDSMLLKNIIEYSHLSKSAEYRSVNIESEYSAHEYTTVMQEWLPEEISLKRQAGLFINRPEYKSMLNDSSGMKLMIAINTAAMKKKGIISGDELKLFRKAIVTAITRKISLVASSNVFMLKSKVQGQKLIEYYNSHKE